MQNNVTIKNSKKDLRRLVLKRRNALTEEQVASFSSKICESLLSTFLTNFRSKACFPDLQNMSDLQFESSNSNLQNKFSFLFEKNSGEVRRKKTPQDLTNCNFKNIADLRVESDNFHSQGISDLKFENCCFCTIAVYDAMEGEVDLTEFVNAAKSIGINVCKPFIVNDESGHMEFTCFDNKFNQLEKFSINDFEVIEPESIDLMICPLVAFDGWLNRLGYGGGFYDRYILRLRPGVPKVGVAFEIQKVNEIPIDEHDLKLDFIFT